MQRSYLEVQHSSCQQPSIVMCCMPGASQCVSRFGFCYVDCVFWVTYVLL
jgi:hypothetical protein